MTKPKQVTPEAVLLRKQTDDLFADALRVLHYLERTKDLGLTYKGDDLALHALQTPGPRKRPVNAAAGPGPFTGPVNGP